MEELGGANRLHNQRNPLQSDRFLGVFPETTTSATLLLELSEHDIFNTSSGSSLSFPRHSGHNPARNCETHTRNHHGILAALNDNLKTPSGPDIRPVFSHKASGSASLSSSSSTSPIAPASSRITIPKRPPPTPPVDRMRLRHQSAPVNVPVIPAVLMRTAMDLGDVSEEEENNGVMLPPHELVEARHSPMLANSVLEGAGRTLKGRDLRQVRNAIWRKTGFID